MFAFLNTLQGTWKLKIQKEKKKISDKFPLSKFALFSLPLKGDRDIENYFVKYEKNWKLDFLSVELQFGMFRLIV